MTNLLIDTAVTDLMTGEGKHAAHARFIQEVRKDHVCNRIIDTARLLQIARTEAKAATQNRIDDPELNGIDDGTGDMVAEKFIKPEQLFSLIQEVANKICWNVRAYKIAQEKEMREAMDNGIDFSQDVADDNGVDVAEITRLEEQVDEAMSLLNRVHGLLQSSSRMGYYKYVNDFAYYSKTVLDEETGDYSQKYVAHNWDAALESMTEHSADNYERRQSESVKADNDLDFSNEENKAA